MARLGETTEIIGARFYFHSPDTESNNPRGTFLILAPGIGLIPLGDGQLQVEKSAGPWHDKLTGSEAQGFGGGKDPNENRPGYHRDQVTGIWVPDDKVDPDPPFEPPVKVDPNQGVSDKHQKRADTNQSGGVDQAEADAYKKQTGKDVKVTEK